MTYIVYSKPNCPFCVKAKRALQIAEQKHVSYELDRDFTREEFITKFGEGSTFPRVVLSRSSSSCYEENLIGGCNDLIKYLRENKLL